MITHSLDKLLVYDSVIFKHAVPYDSALLDVLTHIKLEKTRSRFCVLLAYLTAGTAFEFGLRVCVDGGVGTVGKGAVRMEDGIGVVCHFIVFFSPGLQFFS